MKKNKLIPLLIFTFILSLIILSCLLFGETKNNSFKFYEFNESKITQYTLIDSSELFKLSNPINYNIELVSSESNEISYNLNNIDSIQIFIPKNTEPESINGAIDYVTNYIRFHEN